jgi:hypothetical protein
MKQEGNIYTIEVENPLMLEKLIETENIFFAGEKQMNS